MLRSFLYRRFRPFRTGNQQQVDLCSENEFISYIGVLYSIKKKFFFSAFVCAHLRFVVLGMGASLWMENQYSVRI